MNALVLYDSKFGNTEVVAKTIAYVLNGFGAATSQRISETSALDLNNVDFLIIGSPTQDRDASPATRAFLDRLPPNSLMHISAAAFDTRLPWPPLLGGSGAHSIARRLRQLGAKILLSPESFTVKATEGPLSDGEFERATGWARLLWEEFEPAQDHARAV